VTPFTEPKTDPEIPFDADLERALGDDDPTPAPTHIADPCRICKIMPLVRIRDDVYPPGCEREARAFLTCVSTQDGRWALCAPKFLIEIGAFRWYFGPELRKGPLRSPPPGMPERRGKLPPPFNAKPREDDQ
jgi:hypothetical protein